MFRPSKPETIAPNAERRRAERIARWQAGYKRAMEKADLEIAAEYKAKLDAAGEHVHPV